MNDENHSGYSLALLILLIAAGGPCLYWQYHPRAEPVSAPVAHEARLAPAGVYFLTQYTSMQTARGVVGFQPGTVVYFKSQKGPQWLVCDGTHDVAVDPSQLTNDLDIAATAGTLEVNVQEALARFQTVLAKAQ